MKNPEDGFLKGRVKSLKYAVRGAWLLITTEHSIMVQFFIGILVSILGFFMHISAMEWMIQLLAIGMVLVAESLNTGIEKLCDFIHPDYHKKNWFYQRYFCRSGNLCSCDSNHHRIDHLPYQNLFKFM